MIDAAKMQALPAMTVMQTFDRAAERFGSQPALRWKAGSAWKDMSWSEYRAEVHRAARGFIALGLEPGKGVSIIGFNQRQWSIADLAAIHAGGVPVGIYTTNSPEQCAYVAGHSDSNIAVVENAEQLAKFLEIRDDLPELKAIVMMTGEHPEDAKVFSWAELLEKGDTVDQADLDARMEAQSPEDVCTLIYTSGTTGDPKGVMLTHDNMSWTSEAAAACLAIEEGAYFLSYLPMSHIAEQVVSLYVPMQVGGCTNFAESMEKLGDNLKEVRPHVFLGVPRVWEKIQAKMMAAGAQNSAIKKKIAAWARKVGARAIAAQEKGQPLPWNYNLANKAVFSKVKERLGLDRSKLNVTSAAPIAKETLDFFGSLGVLINEVYGMSECTGPASMSTPDKFRVGWVGWALPGGEVKIADDGEVCMRGRNVFKGYYKNPEATAETIDDEGWLHSGDIGVKEGEFFKITDRKKDLIITAGGENIAPQVLEGKLKNIVWVSQAIVVGDRRKHLSALLTLDEDKFDDILKASGTTAETLSEVAEDEKVRAWLFKEVEAVNADLARVQQIKKIKILPKDLSIEAGELTPTMKVKRRVVRDKYKAEIEAFYA